MEDDDMGYSLSEFLEKPHDERHKYGWWYITPFALECGEWTKWDEHIKSKYPLQYIFREVICDEISLWWYKLGDWWYNQVETRLRPRNQWARDLVPRQLTDKYTLIPEFLFAAIVHFVEVENGWEKCNWSATDEHQDAWERIQLCYEYVTIERPTRDAEYDVLLNATYPISDKKYHLDLDEPETKEQKEGREKLTEIETKKYHRDIEICKEIAGLAPYLWL